MLFDSPVDLQLKDFCQKRREQLYATVCKEYKETPGSILLFAGFQRERLPFVQDSSFYYYTGVKEPGAVLEIDAEGRDTLYLPKFWKERAQWVSDMLVSGEETAQKYGFSSCKDLGAEYQRMHMHPYVPKEIYEQLLTNLAAKVKNGHVLFASVQQGPTMEDSRAALERILSLDPAFAAAVRDISVLSACQRRKKDQYEIDRLYSAVEVTYGMHEAAAMACKADVAELEVLAAAEYVMKSRGAEVAYPTIVATGKNATTIHHTTGQDLIKKGDLVLIDAGAMVDHYCGDVTRTFPVDGKFTPRQRELYQIVLDTQEHVASVAKPGMWLINKEHPEQSLHHIAYEFLKKKGLAQYFTHGIGHFLGTEVHDVGDFKEPLTEGDVFTIEPGIYIPEEGIGIRIEDDYWMVKNGAVCLSDEVPKKPDDIEKLMKEFK